MKALKFSIVSLSIIYVLTLPLIANARDSLGQKTCPYKNMREAIDTISARETEHAWQRIEWRTNSAVAIADAKREGKPIFVFFVVKQKAASPTSWVGNQNDTGKT